MTKQFQLPDREMQRVWLIGSGQMAEAYSQILTDQSVDYLVVGRGNKSAKTFEERTEIPVITGGVENALNSLPAPKKAIVTVNIEHLFAVTEKLIRAGCNQIMIEKPGCLYQSELERLNALAENNRATVFIAYNRRFYSSVQKIKELAAADGGITSAYFEFTEWSHIIRDLTKGPGVQERWLQANSSPVLDMCISLIGYPAEGKWHSWHGGTLDWHPASARFHGSGLSEKGIPFSYHADWESPGRWGVEVLTRKRRYILRPMETLMCIAQGSVETEEVELNNEVDLRYKPGLFKQSEIFLSDDKEKQIQLCSLIDQIKAFPTYCRMAGYEIL